MIKFYQLAGIFYLEIGTTVIPLQRTYQPILVGSTGSEALHIQNATGGEILPLTLVTDVYYQDGVTPYTLETMLAILILYVSSSTSSTSAADVTKITLTPAMQEAEGDDYPITVIHAAMPSFMDCRVEDKDGYEFNPASFKQSVYETIDGALVCTSTKFWFSGVNADNYYAYFIPYETVTLPS